MSAWSRYTQASSGSKTTVEIDISSAKCSASSSISWVESKPTGTDIKVYSKLSFDDGDTYQDFRTICSNGGSIPNITNYVTDLTHMRMKLIIDMDNFYDRTEIPYISELSVDITPTDYPVSGEFLTPAIDMSDVTVGSANITYTLGTMPTGTAIQIFTRSSSDGVNWGAWTEATSSGATITVDDVYMQGRALLLSDTARTLTPEFQYMKLEFLNCNCRGVWTSPTINVSGSTELDYLEVVSDYVLDTGHTIQIQTRSSEDDITYGKWFNTLPTGKPQHEPNIYVQIRLIWTGEDSDINSVTLSYDDPSSILTLAQGMTKDRNWCMRTYQDVVYACNGVDGLFKYDGTTWSEVDLSILEGTTFSMIEVHNDRLFGVESGGNTVFYSDIDDADTYAPLNSITFNVKDGDVVTGLRAYGLHLVVSKSRSKAVIIGQGEYILGTGRADYERQYIEAPTGCQGFNNLVATDSAIAFMSYEGVKISNLVKDANISIDELGESFDSLTKSRLDGVAMAFWGDLLLVAVPYERGHNSQVWAYNIVTEAWSVYTGLNISNFLVFNIRGEEVLYASDSTKGQIYEFLQGESDVSELVEYNFLSKDFTFGYPEKYKMFRNIYLDYEVLDNDVDNTITFYVDDVEISTVNIPVPSGTEGNTYVARIVPPTKGVILGYKISWRLQGRSPLQRLKLEFVVTSSKMPITTDVTIV